MLMYVMLMLQYLSVSYQSINTKLSLKLHVKGFDVMQSDINSVTTGQVRNKGHLSAQFV